MISQREARRLRKRVAVLEAHLREQHRYWAQDYPGGVDIGFLGKSGDQITTADISVVQTARKLGHAVVLIVRNDELVMFGLPLASP